MLKPILLLCVAALAVTETQIRLRNTGAAAAWVPPIGIPAPDFGINEVKPTAAQITAKCTGWPTTATVGCYYIDKTHGSATDSSNTYGRPDVPRLTVPLNWAYSAGDYVEIHGDGTGGASNTYTSAFRPRGLGTPSNPIWFVGVDKPVLEVLLDFGFTTYAESGYMIFDGIYHRGKGIDIRPRFTDNIIHHIAIRNGVMQGSGTTADNTAVLVGTLVSSTMTTADIVLYNMQISGYGDPLNAEEEVGVFAVGHLTRLWLVDSTLFDIAEDAVAGGHGAERSVSYLYVGRNTIYENTTNALDWKAVTHVVFSQNTVYGHYHQYSVDCKVQYSSGQGEALVPHYAGNSTGPDLWDNYPTEVNLLFNTVYDQNFGIATSTTGVLRVIGNVVYNSSIVPTPCISLNTEGLLIKGVTDDQWWVDNTLYNNDGHIRVMDDPSAYNAATPYFRSSRAVYNNATYVCYAAACNTVTHTGTMVSATATSMVMDASANFADDELIGGYVVITSGSFANTQAEITDNVGATDTITVDWPSSTPTGTPTYDIYKGIRGIDPSNTDYWRAFRLRISGNILANRIESDQSEIDWDSTGFADNSQDVDRNLVFSGALAESLFYGAARTLAYIKANTSHCPNCVSGDPLFVNPGTTGAADFTLQSGSPAIGANTESSAYQSFFDVYGRDIKKDRAGNSRPLCGSWDIGAYERTAC